MVAQGNPGSAGQFAHCPQVVAGCSAPGLPGQFQSTGPLTRCRRDGPPEVSAFMWLVEAWLLEPEAAAQLPQAPGEAEADCAALLRLAPRARCGDVRGLLADPWLAATLGEALTREAFAEALAKGAQRGRPGVGVLWGSDLPDRISWGAPGGGAAPGHSMGL